MSAQLQRLHANAAALLSVAFEADPVTTWLFREQTTRVAAMTALLEPVAAVAEHVDLLDGQAAALWLAVPGPDPDAAATVAALDMETGAVRRFSILNELMEARHPREPHAYLGFVGVRPDLHGQRLGARLLYGRLRELDLENRPAYLEASSWRSVALYRRLGFELHGAPIELPEGPVLHPMWRAAHVRREASTT